MEILEIWGWEGYSGGRNRGQSGGKPHAELRHKMSQKQTSWICLFAGIAVAMVGGFFGTATATNDAIYPKLLGLWAILAILATGLLGAAAIRGSKPARWIAIVFLGLTWAFGVDPAARLLHRMFS